MWQLIVLYFKIVTRLPENRPPPTQLVNHACEYHPVRLVFPPYRSGPNGPAVGCVSEGGGAEPLVTGFGQVSDPGPQRPASCVHRSPKTPAIETAGNNYRNLFFVFLNLFTS